MSTSRVRVKRAYHHGDLRESLITAALQIISKQGAKGLTLRSVARRLGVSQTAPYRHFSSKEALLAAVASEGFRRLSKRMDAEMESAGTDPVARFRAIGHAYFGFALDHPADFAIMYTPRAVDVAADPTAYTGRDVFITTRELVERCQREGLAPKGDATQIVVAAWSLVHGLVSLHQNGQLPRNYDRKRLNALASQITHFLKGLKSYTADR